MLIFGKIEVTNNFEYLITLPGFAKILEIIFSIIALGLGVHAYDNGESEWKESYFKNCLIVVFVLSIIYLLAHTCSDDLVTNKINKIIDTTLHVIGGVNLNLAGALMIICAIEIEQNKCTYSIFTTYCRHFHMRLAAGVFAILSAGLYFVTAFLICKIKSV